MVREEGIKVIILPSPVTENTGATATATTRDGQRNGQAGLVGQVIAEVEVGVEVESMEVMVLEVMAVEVANLVEVVTMVGVATLVEVATI